MSVEEGEEKATELKVMFIETSAKAGFNIKALFRKIAAELPGMDSTSTTKEGSMTQIDLVSAMSGKSKNENSQTSTCYC